MSPFFKRQPRASEQPATPAQEALLVRSFEQVEGETLSGTTLVSVLGGLDSISKQLRDFGMELLEFVRTNGSATQPVSPPALREAFQRNPRSLIKDLSPQNWDTLVSQTRKRGYAPGLIKSADGYYVAEDHIVYKLGKDLEVKKQIASLAASLITSHTTIAIDGGSTTAPLAAHIALLLDAGAVTELKVLTNSLPIISQLAEFIQTRGWSDDRSPVKLLMPCGYLRPNTEAIADLHAEGRGCVRSLKSLIDECGGLDQCFVGANGVHVDVGLTMPTNNELEVKRTFLSLATQPFVLADAGKFGHRYEVVISGWEGRFTILSRRPGGDAPAFQDVLGRYPTRLQLAEG